MLAKVAHVELATDFESRDEEEERHQSVVDPVPQVHDQGVIAERQPELGVPEFGVRGRPR